LLFSSSKCEQEKKSVKNAVFFQTLSVYSIENILKTTILHFKQRGESLPEHRRSQGGILPLIFSMSSHSVLWEAVSQTKKLLLACSQTFWPQKSLGWLRHCSLAAKPWPNYAFTASQERLFVNFRCCRSLPQVFFTLKRHLTLNLIALNVACTRKQGKHIKLRAIEGKGTQTLNHMHKLITIIYITQMVSKQWVKSLGMYRWACKACT